MLLYSLTWHIYSTAKQKIFLVSEIGTVEDYGIFQLEVKFLYLWTMIRSESSKHGRFP